LPFAGFYAEFLPEATEEGLEALYERFFHGLNDEVELLPGARRTLEFCRERGHRTFLLSTIKTSHFELQAGRLGVKEYFEKTFVQINDKREVIRRILEEEKLDPVETVFVGDMVHDVETARYGNVTSVAVLTGFDSWEKLAPARPDVVVQDLPTLLRLLA
jgi:phosphoglycolate phosphatase-like HAD superfamily hydrolase